MLYLTMATRKIIIQICEEENFWIEIDNVQIMKKQCLRNKVNIIFTKNS